MSENDVQLIVSLLKDTTTQARVQQFLKEKGLPYSGSWDEIETKRILPAILDGKLSTQELITFLTEVEEFGNQHVFLYQCSKSLVDKLMDQVKTKKELVDLGFNKELSNPEHLAQPDDPVVSEIRWDEGSEKQLIFKIKETRLFWVPDDESHEGEYLVRRLKKERRRFVTVVALHSNGCLEIRIPARSGDYRAFVPKVLKLIKIISFSDLSPTSLSTAKDNSWKGRDKYKKILRFSNTFLRNANGTKVTLSTGGKADNIASDVGGVESHKAFLDHDGENEGSNLWFNKLETHLSEDIHVNLNGELNEFSIRADCSKSDYIYVLEQLKKLNS